MHFRRIGTVLLAGALVTGLTACGDDDDDETEAGDDAAEPAAGNVSITPVTEDTLTVVTSLPAPGFWNGDDPAAIEGGYEYDIAVALQERLGLSDLEVVNVSFDQLVAGQVGDFDVALSQVTITDEREQVVDFTEPYFESDQGVLVMAGTEVATVDDAKALQWGVQSGTTGADYIAQTLQPEQEAQVFQDLSAGFAALEAGQVDAFMMDTAIVLSQASESGGAEEVVAQFKTGEQYGGILPEGSENADAINTILEELEADGSLSDFATEWLGGDPSAIPVLTP
ncbi:MAG TPA: ABC transporter substrate-binding protein [Acidimicrobiales bacterium]|nr:ABC transporter substrate-binding protein [Acidimicrobiales bacterium]